MLFLHESLHIIYRIKIVFIKILAIIFKNGLSPQKKAIIICGSVVFLVLLLI